MTVFGMQQQETNDKNTVMHIAEVAQYQAGRYISSNEAVWQILSFPIHKRSPTFVNLAVNLEKGQRVYLTAKNVQQIALNPSATTLTAFFTLCQNDAFAKTLLYSEVPTYYAWNASRKLFERRKRGEQVIGQPGMFKEKTIGRLYTIYPNQDECFFLRMLLNDLHWDVRINDACNTSHPKQIRALFAIVLTACSPSSPTILGEKYKSHMAEDIFHRMCRESSNMHLDFTAEHCNEALIMIEDLCLAIANKVLNQLGMPSPTLSTAASFDAELLREQN
ncbi:ATP-dependent DNA helicase [Trichonephila clavipes]|nr:ATP-dependent DNA helicase [Trichonephila clavipes]